MQARIDKVIDFNKSLSAAQIDGKEDGEVTIVAGGNERKFKGADLPLPLCHAEFLFPHYDCV